ncbi:MAG: hypothetical protein OFPII_27290 [Osedax symbiont Rs1]|nr:MAG: hypothetical protein OFPII_27290 [Osedax symbiont Rs1]
MKSLIQVNIIALFAGRLFLIRVLIGVGMCSQYSCTKSGPANRF